MARSFSNAKLLSALVVDGLSLALNRRGYAGVASGMVRVGAARTGMMAKRGEEKAMEKEISETSPWVPDPITGYYRPENHADEIDVAELRNMLLNQKMKKHH